MLKKIYQISKNLSEKYEENKERLQKMLAKDFKIILKMKKKKRSNIVMNVTKISQKWKTKACWVEKKLLYNESF